MPDGPAAAHQLLRRLVSDMAQGGADVKTACLVELLDLLASSTNGDSSGPWTETNLRLDALSAIKVATRIPAGCEPLFTRQGVSVIYSQAAFSRTMSPMGEAELEAIKCLVNILILNADSRAIVRDLGCNAIAQRFIAGDGGRDGAFLLMRLLFLLTVSDVDFAHRLALDPAFTQALKLTLSSTESGSSFGIDLIHMEVLKLLYNILVHHATRIHGDSSAPFAPYFTFFDFTQHASCSMTEPIIHFLRQPNTPDDLACRLSTPAVHAVHALLSFPIARYRPFYIPAQQPDLVVRNLVQGVDHILGHHTEKELLASKDWIEERLAPILALLKLLAEDDDIKSIVQEMVLPSDLDRSQPVHVGVGLTARLIRMLTSVHLERSKVLVGELFFLICNSDGDEMSRQIGLGNAAGFLLSRGAFHIPEQSEHSITSQVNTITGQAVSGSMETQAVDMTDEEKESEAERLFVLFDRLNRTGVIQVHNPGLRHARMGEFEDLDHADVDESDHSRSPHVNK